MNLQFFIFMNSTKTILSIAGVIALSLVVAMASGAWNPSWNPFQTKGGNAVEKALFKLSEAKSLEVNGALVFKVQAQTNEGQQNVGIVLNFRETIDGSDKENLKNKGQIRLETSTEGVNLQFALENILIGKDLYLKITTLPAGLPLGVDLSQFKNKWFSLDTSTLAQMLNSQVDLPTEQASSAINKQQAERVYKELLNAFKGKEVFLTQKTYGQEKEGQHYLVRANQKAISDVLPAFLQGLKKYAPQEQQAEFQQAIDSALTNLPQRLDQFWQKTGGIEFDIWIKNGLPTTIKWQKQFQVTNTQQFEQLGADIKSGSLDVSLTANFSGLNKKFAITKPNEATPLEDILVGLLGDFSNLFPANTATSTE